MWVKICFLPRFPRMSKHHTNFMNLAHPRILVPTKFKIFWIFDLLFFNLRSTRVDLYFFFAMSSLSVHTMKIYTHLQNFSILDAKKKFYFELFYYFFKFTVHWSTLVNMVKICFWTKLVQFWDLKDQISKKGLEGPSLCFKKNLYALCYRKE